MEFAPYGRIPNGRIRKDLRQGTIDQDQEFISFLEGLTNPIVKTAPVDQGQDATGKSKEKVTVTPLVQFLKDKKANKGKEPVSAPKGTKHTRQDSRESSTSPVLEKRPSPQTNEPSSLPTEKQNVQAIKIEKAAREVVQVIQQQVAEVNKSPAPNPATTAVEKAPNTAKPIIANEKKRERGSASAAAKILQRDLGLGTNPRGRGGRRGGSSVTSKPASSNTTPTTSQEDSTPSPPSKESIAKITHAAPSKGTPTVVSPPMVTANSHKPSAHLQPPKGPAASRVNPKAASTLAASEAKTPPQNLGKKPTKDAQVSPTATQAFLKHANPSQGITETLLEEAFAEFGTVTKVEIDKKKGFGYVDFSEPKSLQDAVKASPIKIAEGQVVVLERKTGPSLQARNARGGSSMVGHRGGGPIGPRGGRGGIIGRGGGASRGGTGISNSSLPKSAAAATLPATSVKTLETATASPITTTPTVPEVKPQPADLSTSTSQSISDTRNLPDS